MLFATCQHLKQLHPTDRAQSFLGMIATRIVARRAAVGVLTNDTLEPPDLNLELSELF